MTSPQNRGPYRRYYSDPSRWPSNMPGGAFDAVRITREHVNELAWELDAENLAREIEHVLQGRERRSDPGD